MAALEPPTRPYVATESGLTGSPSARSSSTRIEMDETGSSTRPTIEPPSRDLPSPVEAKEEPPLPQMAVTDPKTTNQQPPPEPVVPQTPQTHITFLVISGRRRTMSFEPDTTVGRVKELVWNAWPTEWEDERPAAPSYLRILYLGKMLQDDDTLTKLKFPTHIPQSTPGPTPTIVHLSIRPYAPTGDSDLKKKRGKVRSGDGGIPSSTGDGAAEGGSGGCCGCVIC